MIEKRNLDYEGFMKLMNKDYDLIKEEEEEVKEDYENEFKDPDPEHTVLTNCVGIWSNKKFQNYLPKL